MAREEERGNACTMNAEHEKQPRSRSRYAVSLSLSLYERGNGKQWQLFAVLVGGPYWIFVRLGKFTFKLA